MAIKIKKTFYQHKCLRCGKTWESQSLNPRSCGRCKSKSWNVEKSK